MARMPVSVTKAQQAFSFTRRAMFVSGAQATLAAILGGRMAWLSIVENQKYALLAESNRVNFTLIPPRRGWIVDRNGKPLALNRTAFRVDIIPDRLVDKAKTLTDLQAMLGLTADDIDRIERDLKHASGFRPVQVAENIPWEKFAAISIRAAEFPGVAPAQSYSRFYPDGAAVGHLLGYVGAASAKQYEETKDPLLVTPGFKVGKEGLERTLETVLRGKPGAKRTEVTASGKLVRELASRADTSGLTAKLTIEAGLQAYAARRMGDASGSCVVLDCVTGDVVAMVSMPAYDPNSFSDGIGKSEWAMLRADDHIPLANKTLQGLYPPGSTCKPTTMLGLLSAGIDPKATVTCTGSYRVGGSIFHCASRRGHGAISMHRALVQSCDIYFYHFGRLAGIDPLAAMAQKMSFGQKFDLPYSSQSYGTFPNPEWLARKYERKWSVADTINASIGQGYVLVNPLQLAVMAGRIASGRQIIPRLLDGKPHAPAPLMDINPEHLAFLRDAMSGVVNTSIGTAPRARLPLADVKMGGKTGTAQVRRITLAERARGVRSNASLPWKFRDHSLFVAFAPVDNPRFSAAVIIEHGGSGAGAAAPIARDVMTYIFDPAKAMATLLDLERGWGGDIATRMAKQRAKWDAENAPKPPVDPAAAEASNASNAADNAAANVTAPDNADTPDSGEQAPEPVETIKSAKGRADPVKPAPPPPEAPVITAPEGLENLIDAANLQVEIKP
ncbi:MAG: penicillin-binding protein 2 [Sphingomonadaceae bacterium]